MKRTSPAVALLLIGSADAFAGLNNMDNINAPFPDPVGTWGSTGVLNYPQVLEVAANALTLYPGTSPADYTPARSSCVDCIRSGSVWCSRTWLAEQAAAPWVIGVKAEANSNLSIPSVGSGQDLGTCCYAAANDYVSQPVGTTDIIKANKYGCPSTYINDGASTYRNFSNAVANAAITAAVAEGGAGGTSTAIAMNVTDLWWCSDGYTNHGGASAVKLTVKKLIPNASGVAPVYTGDTAQTGDPRTELFLANCRQLQDICGVALVNMTVFTTAGTANAAVSRTIAKANMTRYEKCTWVVKSFIGAPTFKVEKESAGLKVLDAKYQLHYMEYTGTLTSAVGAAPLGQDATSGLVYPHVGWAQLKGRRYDTNVNWGRQVGPDVWAWQDAAVNTAYTNNAACVSAATPVPGCGLKAWFPVGVAAAEIAEYNVRKTAYTAAYASYDALRTAYNTKLADSQVAKDAFAEMFSPSEPVVVPARPSMPTDLGAYAGLRQRAWAASQTVATAGTASQQVAATDFVVDGSHSGGWGAFTMGLLPHQTSTDGMQKSFGVFGWGFDIAAAGAVAAYAAEGESFTQDWGAMCLAAAADAATVTVDQSYGHCPTGLTAYATAANTSHLVLSVWAADAGAVAFGAGSGTNEGTFKVSFNLSKWKQNATAWAAPAPPAAGTQPTAVAGAKMLAVSMATAAVAAALY